MFRFENPQAFFYFWLIPILIVFAVAFSKRAQSKLKRALGSRVAPFLTASVSKVRRRWKLSLQCVVLFFFILALARPQMGESKQEVRSEGVEIMFVVDVSNSMLAEDVKPNRLEQAKVELSKLIDQMPGNKIGIIAFAGSATLLSPLTTDPTSLKLYLESLSPLAVSTQGTEFHSALSEAGAAFQRGGAETDDTVKVTRVILLASDGEDHGPQALEEAEKLAQKGIRIFTLVYGTEKGGAIPERDGMGFLRGYKKDNQGQTVLSTVKGDALRALAEKGKGVSYHASFGGDHMQKILADLNQLEKTQFESEIATQFDERFQIFVFFGILFAMIELLLGDRRPGSRLWSGRFEDPEGEKQGEKS
ncbi:MAG: VWA domain-containing protein [Pseudobdellovibrionaceae bacterium]